MKNTNNTNNSRSFVACTNLSQSDVFENIVDPANNEFISKKKKSEEEMRKVIFKAGDKDDPRTPAEADDLVGVGSTDLFVALVRRHSLTVNELTETQLAEAIRQAMPDFLRHVHVTGQKVVYIPGKEADRWKTLYHELLLSVESVHEGETRHETALRYIRERETHSNGPTSDSSTNSVLS
jgi:hypothetical protein